MSVWPVKPILLIALLGLGACPAWAQPEKSLSLSVPGGQETGIRLYVNPAAGRRAYPKVAVMPFRAQGDLVGDSISDLFATELLTTHKYQLIDRIQAEQILKEKMAGGKNNLEATTAVQAGKLLGAQGVIIGIVPEYGIKISENRELTAMALNVRMIDVSDGSIVWSISDTVLSDRSTTLSALAQQMVRNLVAHLFQEMIRAGDILAVALPVPRVVRAEGRTKGALVEIQPDSPGVVAAYKLLRGPTEKGPFQEIGLIQNSGSPVVRYEDSNLKDGEHYFYQVLGVSPAKMTSRPTPPFNVMTAGPPGAVTGFTAQSDLIRRVALTWKPETDPKVRGYVLRRKTEGGDWEKVKTLDGREASTAVDQDLGDAVTYAYRIAAVYKDGGEAPPSPVVTAKTKGPPSKVQKLEVFSLQPRRVPLKWSPVDEPEVKGYAVFRAARADGPFEKIAFVDGKDTGEFVDGVKHGFFGIAKPLEDETRYYYKVQAVNVVDVPGPDSPTDNAVTKPVPEPVQGVQTQQREVKRVTLKWKAAEEADIVKYQIFRGRDPKAIHSTVLEVKAPATEGIDQGLEDGTQYYYQVRAVDKDGLEGKLSTVVSSLTKPVPVKPQGLQAVVDGNRIRLRWQSNPEPDIRRYSVFLKSFLLFWEKIGEVPGTEFLYQGEMKKGKTQSFRILAIDADQLEGEPSEEVQVVIP